MGRSGAMVLLAHCILNPNSKVGGSGSRGKEIPDFLEGILREGIGIVQLPCPEQTFGGCLRWGMTREQYDTPRYRRHCRDILELIVDQSEDYRRAGYEILGIVGIDGSPSCGVERTCIGYEGGEIASMRALPACSFVAGRGVLMECLLSMLGDRGLSIPAADWMKRKEEPLTWDVFLKKLHSVGTR